MKIDHDTHELAIISSSSRILPQQLENQSGIWSRCWKASERACLNCISCCNPSIWVLIVDEIEHISCNDPGIYYYCSVFPRIYRTRCKRRSPVKWKVEDFIRKMEKIGILLSYRTCFVSSLQFSKLTFNASNSIVIKLHLKVVILSITIIPNKPPETAQVSMKKLISCQGDTVVFKGYFALIGKPFSIGVKHNRANPRQAPITQNPKNIALLRVWYLSIIFLTLSSSTKKKKKRISRRETIVRANVLQFRESNRWFSPITKLKYVGKSGCEIREKCRVILNKKFLVKTRGGKVVKRERKNDQVDLN